MDELQYQLDLLTAMNQKLSSDEKMYRLLCESSTNAFLYYSFEEDRLETIGNWKHFFECQISRKSDIPNLYEAAAGKYILPLQDALFPENKGLERVSREFCTKDGRMWVECEANVTYDLQKRPMEKVLRFKDITKFKRQNDELIYMAYYDNLTGLYNRNYFVRDLSNWLEKAKNDNAVISVLFVDIDDFRKINDGIGMITGDELVQQVGQFLGSFREDKVIVSHFNSDLYCIAVYDPYGSRSVEHIYHTIKDRMLSPFVLTDGQELTISVSVGVAEYPEAGKSATELINCAEIVMFKAKHTGKNSIQYFDAPILNEFLDSVEIETKLKTAVINQNFCLYYQPQFDVKSGKLRGMEALIRWRQDNGHMVSPSVFIPIAEKNGMIIPIGSWVLEQSMSSLARWKTKYGCPIVLSINISAIQYKKKDFVSRLVGLVREYGLKPEEIELEITESILIEDFGEIIQKMHALREYGIRMSLDDFGTGYSSLSYLKGLPIDTLKIDKSFIDTVTTDESTRIITEVIVKMAKRLGFETIAEGVEAEEQLKYLKDIECDNIQGYLLGRPMPEEELEKLLMTQI